MKIRQIRERYLQMMVVTVTGVAAVSVMGLLLQDKVSFGKDLPTFVSIVLSTGMAVGTSAMAALSLSRMKERLRDREDKAEASEVAIAASGKSDVIEKPFETEQVARYYAEVLNQTKISFWVSIVAASIGFVVIISAAMMYTSEKVGATVATAVAGVIMEAVSALFFVQSQKVQASMGEFFEKLRIDRQQIESRKFCDELTDPKVKDALKLHLSLYYSGIEGSHEVSKTILNLFTPHILGLPVSSTNGNATAAPAPSPQLPDQPK